MSKTPNDSQDEPSDQWSRANDELSQMIEEGRSFSGRERNCCFLNTAGPRFANISAISGLDFPDDGRAVVLVDWDQDGDLDLWTSNRNAPRLRLMRNNLSSENHVLSLRLQGNGTITNRDAIGARVEVLADNQDGKKLMKTLHAGTGFLSQSSKWLHFGLGRATQVELVRVHWPGGKSEDFTGIEINGRHRLVQGAGIAQPHKTRDRETILVPSRVEIPTQSGPSNVRLATMPPMPRRIRYRGFDGEPLQLLIGNGQPVLISLWASWCTPCLRELQELSEIAGQIRGKGVNVLALCVDGLGEDKTDRLAAPSFLSRIGFQFAAGRAEADFVRLLQGYHDEAVVLKQTLPIPTSILIDGQGRLATIYKGPIQLDELWNDVSLLQKPGADRWVQAAPLRGRTIDDERVAAHRKSEQCRTRMSLAEALDNAGRLELAAAHYGDLLDIEPDLAKANRKLAHVYRKLNRADSAIALYRRAIQLEPERASNHYNLANLLNRKGEYEDAVIHYRRSIQLKNDYIEAHVNLGSVFVKTQRYDKAVKEFEQALKINPSFAPARQNLKRIREFLESN